MGYHSHLQGLVGFQIFGKERRLMFSTGSAFKFVKLVALLTALAFCFSSCVDFDKIMDSLIGAESQAPVRDRTEELVESTEEISEELPYTSAEDFVTVAYSVNGHGEGVAIQSYNGNSSYVKIPEYIDGLPVLAILSGAVGDRVGEGEGDAFAVTDIIVPDTVAVIERSAFGGCEELVSIELPFIGGTDGGNDFGYIFGEKGAPKSLESVRAGGTVVPDRAFAGCEFLTCVVLTEAQNVGNNAFENCPLLEEVVLPQSVTAMGAGLFDGCERIKAVTLPYLGDGADLLYAGFAFGGANYLDNMSAMPESLRSLTVYIDGKVPDYAFYECDRLTELTLIGNVQSLGDYSFYRCKRLKTLSLVGEEGFGGVSDLGIYTFAFCSALNAIQLSSDVTSVPDGCFYSCASLRNLTFGALANSLPDGVTSIGYSSFAYCENLVGMELSSAITTIPDDAFLGCAYLTEVTIPKAVEAIGDNAFKGCGNMKSLVFEQGSRLELIGDSAFGYCTSLKELSLPDSVEGMGDFVLAHCWSLKAVRLSTSLSVIPDGTFFGCTVLVSAEYNESAVTQIGERAFSGCERIESITLPSSVVAIGDRAFDECEKLVFNVDADTYAYEWLVSNGISSKNIILN